MKNKVSVIIPFYNNKEWLEEALESVFNQTYRNIEVVLVNDGSREDISDILKKYESKIIYLKQDNQGPGAARNNGVRKATGYYVAFEDSDDVWLPEKLEKQVALMESSGAAWCHTGFYNWWPKNNKKIRVNSSRDYDDIYLQRHVSTKIATPSVMIKRDVLASGSFMFPEDIRNGEDGSLYTELSKYYPIALVQEPLVKVRMRGTNSKNHAYERFILNAKGYESIIASGEKFPFMVMLIDYLYYIYTKVIIFKFGIRNELFIKFCWTIPYVMERAYVRYLGWRLNKDERYIIREVK